MTSTFRTYCLLAFAVGVFLAPNVLGQEPNNEWINYDWEYFKVEVEADGIHRITRQTLEAGGFPVRSVDPRTIKLYFRGQEVSIFVSGEEDGQFDPGDYIEFYGKQNRGALDNLMYDSPEDRPNPARSLVTDRTTYFITYDRSGGQGLRWTLTDDFPDLSLPAYPYHLEELERSFFNDYGFGGRYPTSLPSSNSQAALPSRWPSGKGPADTRFGLSDTRLYNLPVRQKVNGANQAITLEGRLQGRSFTNHRATVRLNGSLLGEFGFTRYEALPFEVTVNDATLPLGDSEAALSLSLQDVGGSDNFAALAYAKLTYPQETDAFADSLKYFYLPAQNTDEARLAVRNPAENARLYDVTNERAVIRIDRTLFSGGRLQARIPNARSARKVLQFVGALPVGCVSPADMRPIDLSEKSFILISHPELRRPAGNYQDPVAAYADYRASQTGGEHEVLDVDVTQLFDQYGFGEPHPYAIRNFLRRVYDLRPEGEQEQYVLIIGKGLSLGHRTNSGSGGSRQGYQFERNRNPCDETDPSSSLQWPYRSYVPTYGDPGSDALFTVGFNNSPHHEMTMPTGRVSARDAEQVAAYLDKVKEQEAQAPNQLWRKRLLHVSGGFGEAEFDRFRAHMENLGNVATTGAFGGEFSLISRRTTNTVEFVDIKTEVNEGVSVVAMYGHSSQQFNDIEIGFASNPAFGYRNQGRYPLLFINGCFAGDAFGEFFSIGEDWVLTPNAGSILTLAHSHFGYDQPMIDYDQALYDVMFNQEEWLEAPFGAVLKEAVRQHNEQAQATGSSQRITFARLNGDQFALQGDPAVRLFGVSLPDYATSDADVSLLEEDEQLTARADEFTFRLAISNLGVATNEEPFFVGIRRTFADGSEQFYTSPRVEPVRFADTITIRIEQSEDDKTRAGGFNIFEFTIDPSDEIAEFDETNNVARLTRFFPSGAMIALAPRAFALVRQPEVTLVAQNTDVLSGERAYEFQLDTTALFDSPLLQEQTVNGNITPDWTVNLPSAPDSTVFYWRARFANPQTASDSVWARSSFTYLANAGAGGWSQSHVYQFEANELQQLRFADDNGRKWRFFAPEVNLEVRSVGANFADPTDYFLRVNGQTIVAPGECSLNRWIVVSFDRHTGELYLVPDFPQMQICGLGYPGQAIRAQESWLISNANVPNTGQRAFHEVYETQIRHEGDYVLSFTSGSLRYSRITDEHLTLFAKLGVEIGLLTSELQQGEPFISLGRYIDDTNNRGTASDIAPDRSDPLGDPPTRQQLEAEFSFQPEPVAGTIRSAPVGPAEAWGELQFEIHHATDAPNAEESWKLDIYGLQGEQETLLIEDIRSTGIDLGETIDAEAYPRIRLQVTFQDSLDISPAQLFQWRVLYQESPEGILTYGDSFDPNDLAFSEGRELEVPYLFRNISSDDFEEEIVVRYTLTDLENNTDQIWTDTLSALAAGESLPFTAQANTQGLTGRARLTAFANPPEAQSEQLYDNNVLQLLFTVNPDQTNPLLDVTFDGRYIMNGEIVSPSPVIEVRLRDENQLLPVNSPEGFDILLRDCPDCSFRRILPTDPETVDFGPDGEGGYRIRIQPQNLADGLYTLRAQGQDFSGNLAGVDPYEVDFEIVNESTITHFYPYPNPFSTSVRFVFTLTGSQTPERLKIQIMTVSGRVVREITHDEIGPIRIGNNITEYAWDGKDEFGDQLANGVYLYRVVIDSSGGQRFGRRATARDDLFKQGFGKMYLMR